MNFENILDKFREIKKRKQQQEFATEGVYDPVLIRLRNDRIKQMQEQEKRTLKEEIKNYNMAKSRKELWGMKKEPPKNGLVKKHNSKNNYLNDKRPLLKEKFCFKNSKKILK